MLIYGRLNIYCFVHLASFRHCLNVNPLQKLPIVWPVSLSLLFDLSCSHLVLITHNSVCPDIKLRLDRPGHLTPQSHSGPDWTQLSVAQAAHRLEKSELVLAACLA